jgi:beta-lactam-binding protein with PASTA domain/predicted Ser/Thr protein kinase
VPKIAENTVVDSRYRVLERIGAGGMADVYLAEDTHLGRRLALKLLHERFAQDREFVERFRREASSAAGLQHPNIVGVYDRGEFDGTYYIAMEYCPGRTLKQLIEGEAPLDPKRAIHIAKQMLYAARFAHQHGVIHRDFKPQNVVLDDEENVKVTDFGIARQEASDITEVGAIVGTAQYLSPEQACGTAVTAASDLYSIGVVLFEMLTGHAPFEGDSAVSIALKHVSESPASPRQYVEIAPALEAVVMKSLAKDPASRYADADAFIADLDAASKRLSETPRDPTDTVRFDAVPVALAAGGLAAAGAGEAPEASAATALAPEPVAGDVVEAPDGQPPDELEGDDRSRRRKWLIGGAAIAALAIAAVLFALLRGPEQRAVPSVIGKPLAVAQQQLEQAGFKVDIHSRPDKAPKDNVIEQIPAAGKKVDKGSVVTVTVSSGPSTVKVPDVVGVTQATARGRIKRVGLKPAFRKESSTKIEAGLVVRTDPGAGIAIDRGSEVIVYVSSGAKQVAVPDVIGLEQTEARQQLSDTGFNVIVEERSSDEPDGTVVRQSPAAGQRVDEGSTVTIIVSKGDLTRIPDVTGLTEREATAQIERAGFKAGVRTRTVESPEQDGIVLSQSPRGTSQRSEGSTVTLTIGRFESSDARGTP